MKLAETPGLAIQNSVRSMLEAISLPVLLRSPRYLGGVPLDHARDWARPDLVALRGLAEDGADIERAAASLGRRPTALAHYAYDTGLAVPRSWRDAIVKRKLSAGPAKQNLVLQYPYITKVRGEHATLLLVNKLVPHGLPSHLRADVCQEIMLAIWSGEYPVEEFQSNRTLVNSYIKNARKENYEGGGFALSLDMPMRDGRSWYDVLPEGAGVWQ